MILRLKRCKRSSRLRRMMAEHSFCSIAIAEKRFDGHVSGEWIVFVLKCFDQSVDLIIQKIDCRSAGEAVHDMQCIQKGRWRIRIGRSKCIGEPLNVFLVGKSDLVRMQLLRG